MTLRKTPFRLRPWQRAALAAVVASSVAMTQSTVAVAQAAPVSRIVLGIGADETQANVAWQSRTTGPQYLEYWPTDNPGSIRTIAAKQGAYNAAIFYPQEATMQDLQPNTSYTYRVLDSKGLRSAEYTFQTGDFSDSWNFLALADAQIGVGGLIAEQTANWDRALETATKEHPNSSFIMHLGDQVEGWGDPLAQYEGFLSPDEVRSYRLGVLKGNHETYGTTPHKHFDDSFSLPNEVGNSANYYFEYNNVLFIGLDSNRSTAADIAEHAQFVSETVAEYGAANDWIIVGFHHAPFSQGTHYTDADIVRLREQLTPALSAAGVDLVLSGHDHIYTRSHLMEGSNPVIPESQARSGDVLEPAAGQVLYVTSTTAGGGKYYDFQGKDGTRYPRIREERARDLAHDSTARWRQDYNPDYTNIQVTPTTLTLTTYNVNTPYVVDKVTLSKAEKPKVEKPKEEKPKESETGTTPTETTPGTDTKPGTSENPEPAPEPAGTDKPEPGPEPSDTTPTTNTPGTADDSAPTKEPRPTVKPASPGQSEGQQSSSCSATESLSSACLSAFAGIGIIGLIIALILFGFKNAPDSLSQWVRDHLPF